MLKNETQHLKTGRLGEDIASKFLQRNGYSIVERNYWRKWGEIDIVAKEESTIHFVEVKATRCNVFDDFDPLCDSAAHPEEHMHTHKQERLKRVLQTYLTEHSEITSWVFDVLLVYIDTERKRAVVKRLENIVL